MLHRPHRREKNIVRSHFFYFYAIAILQVLVVLNVLLHLHELTNTSRGGRGQQNQEELESRHQIPDPASAGAAAVQHHLAPVSDDRNATTGVQQDHHHQEQEQQQQQQGEEDKQQLTQVRPSAPPESRNNATTMKNPFENLAEGAEVWRNMSSFGFYEGAFSSGFRNQMMVFTILVLEALNKGYGQIVMETIGMKDLYGSNQQIPFHALWDIPHWNSHYPLLPRLIHFDPIEHDQFNPASHRWYRRADGKWTDVRNVTTFPAPTRPIPWGRQHHLYGAYRVYAKGKGDYVTADGRRNPAELLMMKGAIRAHPRLQEIIDENLRSLETLDEDRGERSHSDRDGRRKKVEYMTLHARIEPDMQRLPVCRDQKVLNLTDIFDWVQNKWPEPPVKHVFMPINRKLLEQEGSEKAVKEQQRRNRPVNWIAVENLRVLNQARDEGLWNGRAKVFEFGANVLKDTEYGHRPSTTGALINFFTATEAKIFIGSELSTFSHDLLATRFYRNSGENYKYLPDGLHDWTPPGTVDPPGYTC